MFNEKSVEIIDGQELKVWQSPKYLESKKKAIEIIEDGSYGVTEADFWILMNKTKSGKMAYTGVIISHNGCLKINDKLPENQKFRSECLSRSEGYKNSLIYEYNCPEQGIYEVGEVNATNCKNDYPFAMAFKRCFDRVVLKNSKLAFAGVYSDSEADEFKEKVEVPEIKVSDEVQDELKSLGGTLEALADYYKCEVKDLTDEQVRTIIELKKNKIKKSLVEPDENGEVNV